MPRGARWLAATPPRRLARGVLILLAAIPSGVVGAPRAKAKEVPRTELSHACSRSTSRNVRKLLEKEVLKPAAKAGADQWPRGCPLDPARDLWGAHERQKSRKRGSGTLWTCGLSGKVFRSEHYLDLHLERKHMNETPHAGICLADYCEVFEVCHGDSSSSRSRRKQKDAELNCDNETMAMHRRRCEDGITKCFPLAQEAPRRMHAHLSREFCRVLDCRIRAEQRKEHHTQLMPVVVLLILMSLICFIVFGLVACCVEYSDDILQFLVESGVTSQEFVKRATKTREQTRRTLGLDRPKRI